MLRKYRHERIDDLVAVLKILLIKFYYDWSISMEFKGSKYSPPPIML